MNNNIALLFDMNSNVEDNILILEKAVELSKYIESCNVVIIYYLNNEDCSLSIGNLNNNINMQPELIFARMRNIINSGVGVELIMQLNTTDEIIDFIIDGNIKLLLLNQCQWDLLKNKSIFLNEEKRGCLQVNVYIMSLK